MPECRKIVIVARGDTEGDLELALEEALKRIRDGNLAGSDRNDEGGFYLGYRVFVLFQAKSSLKAHWYYLRLYVLL